MNKGRKHTKAEVDRILQDIRSMQQNNITDSVIRKTLGLELRQFQYFTKRINAENERIWTDIVENQIYLYLIKLKESFFHTYKTALAKAEDPEYKDRLTALQIKDDAILSLTQILLNAPEMELVSNNEVTDPTTTTKIDYAALAKQQYEKNRQPHP